MNPLLERYIKSSIAKHFKTVCDANSTVFITDWEFQDTGRLNEWVELRVVGPEYKRLGANDYRITLEVDLLVSSAPSKSFIQRVPVITGFLAANCENIPIFDSNTATESIFCLKLDDDIAQNIRVIQYGQQAGIKQRRASVMAFYETETVITI